MLFYNTIYVLNPLGILFFAVKSRSFYKTHSNEYRVLGFFNMFLQDYFHHGGHKEN